MSIYLGPFIKVYNKFFDWTKENKRCSKHPTCMYWTTDMKNSYCSNCGNSLEIFPHIIHDYSTIKTWCKEIKINIGNLNFIEERYRGMGQPSEYMYIHPTHKDYYLKNTFNTDEIIPINEPIINTIEYKENFLKDHKEFFDKMKEHEWKYEVFFGILTK